jgi:hypothetical protein
MPPIIFTNKQTDTGDSSYYLLDFHREMSGKSDSSSSTFQNRLAAQRLRLSPINDMDRKRMILNRFFLRLAADRETSEPHSLSHDSARPV